MTDKKNVLEPIELKEIKTFMETKADDLFICWGSFEDRCKGSILKMHSDYKAKHIFILRYSNHNTKKIDENINEMKNKLKKVGKVEEILIDENKPLPVIKEICEKIENVVKNESFQSITIDVSTSIKWHLFMFLKFLDLRNLLGNVRFLYTEPEDYITDLFESLSFGINEIFPIPTYHGNYDFSKGDLLVITLGYEGNRAVALYEDIDPAECILLIADPPYKEAWKGRAEEMNTEIINIVGASKIKYIDSMSPLKAARQFHKILSDEKYADYNHIICPLGTKPQALGLYLYLSTNPSNTILIYGAPLRRNELFYSYGIGRTWQLPFEKLEVN